LPRGCDGWQLIERHIKPRRSPLKVAAVRAQGRERSPPDAMQRAAAGALAVPVRPLQARRDQAHLFVDAHQVKG
jgi:hypothetical protein